MTTGHRAEDRQGTGGSPPVNHTFLSDNSAGVHPDVLAAIAAVNHGHQPAYGEDEVTARAGALFRAHFGPDSEGFLVLNGTAANVIALRALTSPWGAVVCARSAHVNTSEGGAPEKIAGVKLIPVETDGGKLTPDQLAAHLDGLGDQQAAQPEAVSPVPGHRGRDRLLGGRAGRALPAAHELGLRVHLDGARLCNAAAALDVPLRALTTEVGVDIVSFGGAKNGLMIGEAVVALRPHLAGVMKYLRKLDLQLCSKMRFVAAQFEALLGTDLWLRNARHANAMARLLESGLRGIPGIQVARPAEANAVFVTLPGQVASRVGRMFAFHVWDRGTGTVRFMTGVDTHRRDVDALLAALRHELPVPRARS